jgi:hypothetical protein
MFTRLINRIKPNFRSASVYSILIIFIVMIWVNFNIKRWKEANVIDWDVTSYYGYLPAAFIHHDLKLDFTKGKEDDYKNKHQFWPETAPNGGKVIKTTMGMAILYTPFFLVAHTMATAKGYETDGFSEPYEKYIHLSSLFYLILGLIFLRKVLIRFFNDWVVALVLVFISIGTNMFFYTTTEAAMSHTYNFALFSIFIFLSLKWHENKNWKWSIAVGIIGGMIVLIRPVNILVFIFPVLYGVKSFEDLKNNLMMFFKEWKQLLIIGFCSFLMLLPQLLYWKYITGSFFFNSYVGERFYFGNPHILEGLFSYRKGWLLYTPIMFFAVFGFVLLYKKHRDLFWPVLTFTLINIYVLFCWWAWWYGGGFGLRAMVDSYALLSIPMAAFFHFFIQKGRKLFFTLFTIIAFVLVGFNLFQTAQYRSGAIHWDGMTKESYWQSFGILVIKDPAYWETIKSPDYDAAREGKDEYDFNPF